MNAYSVDLRTRVRAALDAGMPHDTAITTFQISRSTIKRWLGRRQRTGDLTPGQSSGRPTRVTAVGLEQRQTRLQDAPAATLDAHLAWWHTQPTLPPISRATRDRASARLGWSQKNDAPRARTCCRRANRRSRATPAPSRCGVQCAGRMRQQAGSDATRCARAAWRTRRWPCTADYADEHHTDCGTHPAGDWAVHAADGCRGYGGL